MARAGQPREGMLPPPDDGDDGPGRDYVRASVAARRRETLPQGTAQMSFPHSGAIFTGAFGIRSFCEEGFRRVLEHSWKCGFVRGFQGLGKLEGERTHILMRDG